MLALPAAPPAHGHLPMAAISHTSEQTNNVLSVQAKHTQSHPVRAVKQWCPDLPKVSAALKFSARCARSCKLYSIVQAAGMVQAAGTAIQLYTAVPVCRYFDVRTQL